MTQLHDVAVADKKKRETRKSLMKKHTPYHAEVLMEETDHINRALHHHGEHALNLKRPHGHCDNGRQLQVGLAGEGVGHLELLVAVLVFLQGQAELEALGALAWAEVIGQHHQPVTCHACSPCKRVQEGCAWMT